MGVRVCVLRMFQQKCVCVRASHKTVLTTQMEEISLANLLMPYSLCVPNAKFFP
jgi:hypothetical protein